MKGTTVFAPVATAAGTNVHHMWQRGVWKSWFRAFFLTVFLLRFIGIQMRFIA